MESCTLVVLVALFLGVAGIIAMLERRRCSHAQILKMERAKVSPEIIGKRRERFEKPIKEVDELMDYYGTICKEF